MTSPAETIAVRSNPRRFLVIVRAGARSAHRRWGYEGKPRSWDLLVNVWDGTSSHGECEYISHAGANKLQGVQAILCANPALLDAYEVFWLVDDDIETTAAEIEHAFALFDAYRLWVAQPALRQGSNYNFVTHLADPRYLLRLADHVEVMMPMFAREALRACLDTFDRTQSSWGIDWLWWPRLGRPRDRFAIIDATPMHHAKPADEGKGPFYQKLRARGIDARVEMERLLADNGLILWQPTTFRGVVDPHVARGHWLRETFSRFGLRMLLYRAQLKPLRRALRAIVQLMPF